MSVQENIQAIDIRLQGLEREMLELRVKRQTLIAKPKPEPEPEPLSEQEQIHARIEQLIEDHGPLSSGVLKEHLGCTVYAIKCRLEEMVEAGVLVRTGLNRGTRYHLADQVTEIVQPAGSTYREVVRNAARKLGTFTTDDLRAELPDVGQRTRRKWVDALLEEGALTVERIDGIDLYGYVKPTPEITVRRAEKPQRRGHQAVAGTGKGLNTGNKRSQETVRMARKAGATVKFTGRNHVMVEHDGKKVKLAMTPSGSGSHRGRLKKVGIT